MEIPKNQLFQSMHGRTSTPIMWTKAEVLDIDRACRHDVLRFKEAIHIRTSTGHFNRDVRVDIPECWPALLNLMDK